MSAIFGVVRQFLQAPNAPSGFVLPFLFPGAGYGQYIYHNLFAYLMEMAFALSMGLVLGGGIVQARKLIYLAIALCVWAAMILSDSRGAILGFMCQAVFLVLMALSWYWSRRSPTQGREHELPSRIGNSIVMRVAIIIVVVFVLSVGVFWMGGERFSGRLREGISQEQSDTIDNLTRTAVWQSSWSLIKDNIWTGVGFGNYFLAIPQYQTGAGRLKLEQAHNDYLDLIANGGILAAALAAWFAVILSLRVRSRLISRDPYRRAACLGAVAGILSVGVHSTVDFGLQTTGIAIVFAALIVIATADSRAETAKKSQRMMSLHES
jgi:O-antigen ligase